MVVKKKGGKSRTVSVDFEGVEAGGRACPDGTYEAEITSAVEEESSSGNDMIVAKWKILSGKGKGAVIWDNLSLVPQALWRLKGLLEALEVEVPDGSMDLDLDDLIGQKSTVEVTNEDYDGKKRPRITGYGTPGEAEEESEEEPEEEEEKPAAKKKSSKKAEPEEEPEEEEDPPARNVKKKGSAKPKFKEGSKVTFEDEDGKTIKASIVEIDGDSATVEDRGGDQYELDVADLEAA